MLSQYRPHAGGTAQLGSELRSTIFSLPSYFLSRNYEAGLLQGLQRWRASHEVRQRQPHRGRCPNPACKQAKLQLAELHARAGLPAAPSRLGGESKLRGRIVELELEVSELRRAAYDCNRRRATANRHALETTAEAEAAQAAAARKVAAVKTAAADMVAAAHGNAAQDAAAAKRAKAELAAAREDAKKAWQACAAAEKEAVAAEKETEQALAAERAAEARAAEREERSRVRELEAQLRESEQERAQQLRESEQERAQQLVELRELRREAAKTAREMGRLQERSKELTSMNISNAKSGQHYQVQPAASHYLAIT